jgi:adenylate cyclase
MSSSRSKYRLHAEVVVTGAVSADFDDAIAGHPLERRLNRMERVAAIYLGQIDKKLSNGLQIAFDRADAALLCACEMQQRCSVLPQVSGHRLALRIGIHHGLVLQRSKDGVDNVREIASQLALADDVIVASDTVIAALNPDLLKFIQPAGETSAGVVAYQFDWRRDIPSSTFDSESVWPASKPPNPIGPYLVLHYDQKTLELSKGKPAITVGREKLNDLVVAGDRVSRNHCRIEKQEACIVLTDTSTNGTSVAPEEGVELMLKKGSVILRGKGMLFFGRSFGGERRGGVRYEAYG